MVKIDLKRTFSSKISFSQAQNCRKKKKSPRNKKEKEKKNKYAASYLAKYPGFLSLFSMGLRS